MKKIKMLVMTMTVMMVAAMTPAMAQDVQQLEKDIEKHESNIKANEAKILELEEQISELESQLKELKSQKKALQKEVKEETKLRKEKFAQRDDQVYDEEVADVLFNPYNKSDVEEALKSFEGMETKDVIKKKELIEKYGEYSKDLRDFLEKQKKEIASHGKWTYQASNSEIYKKFEKGLKKTKYWGTYNKKEKNESIDYLDRVMDRIMQFKNDGLKSEAQINELINMLYEN